MRENSKNEQAIVRLSALWAIAEITLGGLLHALRLPLTGLLVGSVALACIYLIARSTNSYSAVLKALVIVSAIKMMATPHASPFSYVAMSVQTFCCLPLIGRRGDSRLWVTAMFLIASLYSPIQKLLILYVTFGHDGLAVVLNEFGKWVAPTMSTIGLISIPLIMWFGAHLAVGFLLAKWLHEWVAADNGSEALQAEWKRDAAAQINQPVAQHASSYPKLLMPIAVVSMLVLLYLYESDLPTWVHVLWRPLLIILFWQLIVRPIIMLITNRWAVASSGDGNMKDVMGELPKLRSILTFARRKSSNVVGWFDRFREFLKVTILLSVMYSSEKSND
jgi:hypothetical protein